MTRLLLCTSLCLLFLSACEPDEVDDTAPIEGRWELNRALRDNMETQMLDGLYFEFGADSTLQTNLMGNENVGQWTYEDAELQTRGVIPELTYRVVEHTDSTLHINTQLQGYRFNFELVRPGAPG